jgi:hypothetical protein
MPLSFSPEVIRAMGFRPFDPGESLTAAFVSMSVYEARGITLEPGVVEIASGNVAGFAYRLAVGAGVNDTCKALADDSFIEDEDAWKKDMQCSGPFALFQLGPTQPFTVTVGHIKTEQDGSTTTLDSFPALRSEVAQLELAALPPLLTSLACLLGDPDHIVELRKIDRISVGRTPAGSVVRDIRIQFSGKAFVSVGLAATKLAADVRAVGILAPKLNSKAARFFALGLAENDELKSFLYFFLAIEVQTHATFRRIDHARALTSLAASPSSAAPSLLALLERQTDQLRNLFDRFVWCAAFGWVGVTDGDVAQFKNLKAARDDVAHGSTSEPPAGYARQAQQLARKILRS